MQQRPFRRLVVPCSVLSSLVLAASCGFGTAGVVSSLGSGGGATNAPATPTSLLVLQPKVSPADIQIELADAEANEAEVEFLFASPATGGVPQRLTRIAQNPVRLQTSRDGREHRIAWDFANEPGIGTSSLSPGVRLFARIANGVNQDTVVDLGNDAPVVVPEAVTAPEVSGVVPLAVKLVDSSSDITTLKVEYRIVGEAAWKLARAAGVTGEQDDPALTNLEAKQNPGIRVLFFWDSAHDLPGLERDVVVQYTASDGVATALPVTTAPFRVDNNDEPQVTIDDGAIIENGDGLRGIPLPFRTFDEDLDPVQVVFQWTKAGSGFPDLGSTDPSILSQAMKDPTFRRSRQICTPYRSSVGGWVIPVAPREVRVPEFSGADACWLLARGLVGLELEFLRPPAATPASLAIAWGGGALIRPLAALPIRDGTEALVVDEPVAGQSRVRRLDLCSGTVLEVLAHSLAGTPTAVCPTRDGLLVATVLGSEWRLIDISSEGIAERVVSNLTNGPVRGIASESSTSALFTQGGQLVRADWRDAPLVRTSIVVAGLSDPEGIVRTAEGKLYLAERTHAGLGRVVVVDPTTHSVLGLPPFQSGVFQGPTSLALTRDGTALLVLCQEASGVAVKTWRFGTPSDEQPAKLTLPAGTVTIASGPDHLMLATVSGSNDLVASGGIEQRRRITAFQPGTFQVTVDRDFAPVLRRDRRWRLTPIDPFLHPAPGAVNRQETFVWDSRDVLEGGSVVVRALPLDTDAGVPVVTTGSILVDRGFEGPVTTLPGTPVATVDIDGDGAVEILVPNGLVMGIHRQLPEGVFEASPSRVLPSGFVAGYRSVTTGDFTGDARCDIAVANTDGLKVFAQQANGQFAAAVTLQASAASWVTTADVDGNGTLDLVSEGKVFRRPPFSGGFLAALVVPELASYSVPADWNLDGRVDFLAGLRVVTQDATGSFVAGQILQDSGLGFLGDVAVGDLTGDGIPDIVGGFDLPSGPRRVALFEQSSTGFTTGQVVDEVATGSAPRIALGDVDGDGHLDIVSSRQGGTVWIHLEEDGAPNALVLNSGVGAPWIGDLNGDGLADLVLGGTCITRASTRDVGVPGQPIAGPFVADLNGGAIAPLDTSGRGVISLVYCNVTSFVSDLGENKLVEQVSRGAFAPESSRQILGTYFVSHMRSTDLDGLGVPTLIEARTSFYSPTTYLSLPTIGAVGPFATVRSMEFSDIDGDGDLDCAIGCFADGQVVILRREPDGRYGPMASLGGSSTTPGCRQVAIGDLNGDGRMDIAAATAVGAAVFLQSDAGVFSPVPHAVLGSACDAVFVVDLDGDGLSDLAAEGSGQLTIRWQRAGAQLPNLADRIVPGASRLTVARDLDGNGLIDLFGQSVIMQVAPGVFSVRQMDVGGTPSQGLTAADLDTDGDIDFAITAPTRLVWRGR
ncbi:MAG: VCBS repeat-containing protein [Planctomycetota bacterium]